jgi:hypothetical protein
VKHVKSDPGIALGVARAFKDKNIYPVNKDGKAVLKPKEEIPCDESVVNITSDSWGSSSGLGTSSSFT